MTLVNAFGDMTQEETLKAIYTFMQGNMTSYPRDPSNILRVTVSNAPQALIYPANSSVGYTSTAWYATSSSFMVDDRERQKQDSLASLYSARSRWTIT